MKKILTIPMRKGLTALAMLVILMLGFIFSAQHIFSGKAYPLGNPETLFSKKIVNGQATSAWAQSYNENLPYRQAAVNMFGILKYRLFREGAKGVLIGEGSWLYTSEEFETEGRRGTNYERSLEFVGRSVATLEGQGVRVLIVVLPAKADIYPEHLGRYRYPQPAAERYNLILEDIDESGVPVLGLRDPLMAAKGATQVFLSTDTHWTPAGAEAAARAIAANLPDGVSLPEMVIETRELPVVEREGDLVSYVPVGPFRDDFGYGTEPVTPLEAVAQSDDLFGDSEIEVVLVGSSYSANELFSFAPSLRRALGTDVLNVAEEGKGPFEPMTKYLQSSEFRDAPPALVIWEVPARYFDRPNSDAALGLDESRPQGDLQG